MKNPFARCRLNTPEERLTYLADWFRGYKKRVGLEKAKALLEKHPFKDEIRATMRKNK